MKQKTRFENIGCRYRPMNGRYIVSAPKKSYRSISTNYQSIATHFLLE